MSDKKRSAKRKWRNALIAAALTASVILTLPAWSVGTAKAEVPEPSATDRLVLQSDGKTIEVSNLTITRAGTNSMKQGNIVVDLYKVASADKTANYDAYELKWDDALLELCSNQAEKNEITDALQTAMGPSTSLPIDTVSGNNGNGDYLYNENYRNLAQTVAGKVLGKAGTVSGNDLVPGAGMRQTKTIMGSSNATFENLEAGMYLVVAHGENLSPAQYIGTKNNQIVTRAFNEGYTYSYLPELISLPMRHTSANAPQGGFSTAQGAANNYWQYAVTAELKSEMEVQVVPLQIVKQFEGAANAPLSGNNGCVFRIEAELNGENVYSNVVAVEFQKGEETVTLDNVAMIPAGAIVTVTEEFDGSAFTGEQEEGIPVTKTALYNIAERRYDVSFTNTYNHRDIGGDIVTNSFTKNASGNYDWNNPRKPADVSNNE